MAIASAAFNKRRITALVSCLMVLASCSGGESTGTKTSPNTITPAAGGIASSADGKVSLSFPPGAVSSAITVTMTPTTATSANVIGGTAYEFGPDGTTFAQPVSLSLAYETSNLPPGTDPASLRIGHRVGATWQPVMDGLQVDSAGKKVRGLIRSFSAYSVTADPCAARVYSGNPYTVQGSITADACATGTARKGVLVRLSSLGHVLATGSLGSGRIIAKEATGSASTGRIFYTLPAAPQFEYRIATPKTPVELLIESDSAAAGGSFNIVVDTALTSSNPGSYSCATYYPIVLPGGTLNDGIKASTACRYNVMYSPYPFAIGKPLLAQNYLVPLEAGKTYTITIDNYVSAGTPALDPTLTVFRNGVVAQSATGANRAVARSVVYSPTVTASYIVEVSSGYQDGSGAWYTPEGNFRLRVVAN